MWHSAWPVPGRQRPGIPRSACSQARQPRASGRSAMQPLACAQAKARAPDHSERAARRDVIWTSEQRAARREGREERREERREKKRKGEVIRWGRRGER